VEVEGRGGEKGKAERKKVRGLIEEGVKRAG
jgi:hypothetical protein